MGTPDFAVPALTALVAAGHEVIAVYTQPPRPGGRRGKELTPTPVQRKAEQLGITVQCPVSLKGSAEQAEFAALGAEVPGVAGYRLNQPQGGLRAPKQAGPDHPAPQPPHRHGRALIGRAGQRHSLHRSGGG